MGERAKVILNEYTAKILRKGGRMKKIITILLIPVFAIIQFLKCMFDLINPVAIGMSEAVNDLFYDMYEFWKRVFKWRDGE